MDLLGIIIEDDYQMSIGSHYWPFTTNQPYHRTTYFRERSSLTYDILGSSIGTYLHGLQCAGACARDCMSSRSSAPHGAMMNNMIPPYLPTQP